MAFDLVRVENPAHHPKAHKAGLTVQFDLTGVVRTSERTSAQCNLSFKSCCMTSSVLYTNFILWFIFVKLLIANVIFERNE